MRDISEIENMVIQYAAISLSAIMFGTLNELYLKPVEASIDSTYRKVKDFYGKYVKR